MAMPSDDSFVPDDENSERAPNVDSYRITCIDFIKDITPILHQVGLDGVKAMGNLEQKGYVDFAKESMKIIGNIVEHFTQIRNDESFRGIRR